MSKKQLVLISVFALLDRTVSPVTVKAQGLMEAALI